MISVVSFSREKKAFSIMPAFKRAPANGAPVSITRCTHPCRQKKRLTGRGANYKKRAQLRQQAETMRSLLAAKKQNGAAFCRSGIRLTGVFQQDLSIILSINNPVQFRNVRVKV